MDHVVDVHVELFHDAGGLGLDLDLGDRLNLARGHDGARHIAARHLGQPLGSIGVPVASVPPVSPDHDTTRTTANAIQIQNLLLFLRCSHEQPPKV